MSRRLLITTQAVDLDDPILGFFHGWVAEFAKQYDHIDVICLRKGRVELPNSVRVHSLGKEEGGNRITYTFRFFYYLFKLKFEYDFVFSHMNPHYIVLAGWLWRLCNVRIFFWRNHAKMNLLTRIAAWYAERVFYTSPFACTRVFKHSMQMPVGINTDLFKPQPHIERVKKSVLFLGRLSPVKQPEVFAKACSELGDYTCAVYGDEPGGGDTIKNSMRIAAGGHIVFNSSVPNYETPEIYAAHEIYVNLTPDGSMDKTVLEAAACGALVLVSNRSFENMVPAECLLRGTTPHQVSEGIKVLSNLPEAQKEKYRKELREMVEKYHSLTSLSTKLISIMEKQGK